MVPYIYYRFMVGIYYIGEGHEYLHQLHFLYTFAVISIFIGLLMAISSYHINMVLYISINLLITYLVTSFMYYDNRDNIGFFSLLSYGSIIIQTILYPKVLYFSPIGMNNLFYGARYYGYNNGMMGVLIATSIVRYLFIKEQIGNKFLVRSFL